MTAPAARQDPGRPSRRRRRAGAERPAAREAAAAPERRPVRPARRVEGGPSTLVIACGALARELLAVIEANSLGDLQVTCLPGILHNRPEQIP